MYTFHVVNIICGKTMALLCIYIVYSVCENSNLRMIMASNITRTAARMSFICEQRQCFLKDGHPNIPSAYLISCVLYIHQRVSRLSM